MKIVSYICFFIGAVIFAIWILQSVSDLKILEKPLAGAGIFLVSAFLLNVIDRRKGEN